ncbi:MAG: hypothetical protein PHP45_06810 [Elusimicrobiales bacterium]|nr:hypothetical protein [Elusimicrobiales bacterium]
MPNCEGCERMHAHEKDINGNGQPGLKTEMANIKTSIETLKEQVNKNDERTDRFIASVNRAALAVMFGSIGLIFKTLWEHGGK